MSKSLSRYENIMQLVKHVLTDNEASRNDDREIIYDVLVAHGFRYPKEEFLKLPSIGYITRAKRIIQGKHEELR